MRDNGASGNASGLPSGWRVEIDGGSLLPQGAYSMRLSSTLRRAPLSGQAARRLKCWRQMS
jgi:hypothetical protein